MLCLGSDGCTPYLEQESGQNPTCSEPSAEEVKELPSSNEDSCLVSPNCVPLAPKGIVSSVCVLDEYEE